MALGNKFNPIRQQHENKNGIMLYLIENYFVELMRISENQIIWGGNYFLIITTCNVF